MKFDEYTFPLTAPMDDVYSFLSSPNPHERAARAALINALTYIR